MLIVTNNYLTIYTTRRKFFANLTKHFFLVSHKIYISSKKTNNALKFAEVYTKYICATKRV